MVQMMLCDRTDYDFSVCEKIRCYCLIFQKRQSIFWKLSIFLVRWWIHIFILNNLVCVECQVGLMSCLSLSSYHGNCMTWLLIIFKIILVSFGPRKNSKYSEQAEKKRRSGRTSVAFSNTRIVSVHWRSYFKDCCKPELPSWVCRASWVI